MFYWNENTFAKIRKITFYKTFMKLKGVKPLYRLLPIIQTNETNHSFRERKAMFSSQENYGLLMLKRIFV